MSLEELMAKAPPQATHISEGIGRCVCKWFYNYTDGMSWYSSEGDGNWGDLHINFFVNNSETWKLHEIRPLNLENE